MKVSMNLDGFDDLSAMLIKLADASSDDTKLRAQKAGAEYFVDRMRKLSAPRSRVPRSKGHMLDAIDYQQIDRDVETVVGWKLFYGRLVESGHRTMLGYKKKTTRSGGVSYKTTKDNRIKNISYVRARRHMLPEYESSINDIQQKMIDVYLKEMGL